MQEKHSDNLAFRQFVAGFFRKQTKVCLNRNVSRCQSVKVSKWFSQPKNVHYIEIINYFYIVTTLTPQK